MLTLTLLLALVSLVIAAAVAAARARRATEYAELRPCLVQAGQLDAILARGWHLERMQHHAYQLRRYGHHRLAYLWDVAADRRTVELMLQHQRQVAWRPRQLVRVVGRVGA